MKGDLPPATGAVVNQARAGLGPDGLPSPIAPIRNASGRFSKLVCVNAHDRCFGGADGDCPFCEVKQ